MRHTIDLYPFETLEAQRSHAQELNRIRRDDEIRQARRNQDITTRIYRVARVVNH